MTTVGLPNGPDWTLHVEPKRFGERIPGSPRLAVLLYDYHVPICVDEENEGRVVSAATDDVPSTFVNSSIQAFGKFLVTYQQYRLNVGKLEDLNDEVAELRLVEQTEEKMRELDPQALENENYFWTVIIEQMRDGFL